MAFVTYCTVFEINVSFLLGTWKIALVFKAMLGWLVLRDIAMRGFYLGIISKLGLIVPILSGVSTLAACLCAILEAAISAMLLTGLSLTSIACFNFSLGYDIILLFAGSSGKSATILAILAFVGEAYLT
jgi:hypothetical protein